MAVKKCSKCGVEKPATREYFHRQTSCAGGLRPNCKDCHNSSSAQYRLTQRPEDRAAYRRAYRAKNRALLISRDREYYAKNRLVLIPRMVEYNRKNKEAYLEKMRQWRKKNKDKVQIWVRNRRAKLRGLSGTHTLQDILDLLREQRGLCVYCRADISKRYQVDHVMPVALGGGNDKGNLQLLCKACNLDKRDKHPDEYAKSLERAA